MTRTQAMTIIKDAVKNGKIVVCTHAKKQMLQRDIGMTDVLYVLKNGKIIDPPEPHIKTNNLRWRVESTVTDGQYLKVIVEIENDGAVVITVF